MSWQNIASQSSASVSKIAIQVASEALEDFLNDEDSKKKVVELVDDLISQTQKGDENSENSD